MSLSNWRQFSFFDTKLLAADDTDDKTKIFKNPDVTTICASAGNVLVGDNQGSVRILSKSWNVVMTFTAYENGQVTHMKRIKKTSTLITIGDTPSAEAVLKIWHLDRLDKKTKGPHLHSTINIHTGSQPFPISAFAALDNLSQIAIGFANGTVLLLKGEISVGRAPKQRTIFESEEPITALGFVQDPKQTSLNIVTTNRIMTSLTSGKGQGGPSRLLDALGCALGCVAFRDDGEMIVGRDDAVYVYGAESKGGVYAFEGRKSVVSLFGSYIVVISPPSVESKSIRSTISNIISRAPDAVEQSKISILDVENKFIVHSGSVTGGVKEVFSSWGNLYLITTDGEINELTEKDMTTKLDILYSRNLHQLAIQFAESANLPPKQTNGIVAKYADYLFSRGEYDAAIQQYLRALDSINPSEVIRKYLDVQRIANLVQILEELHAQKRANSDHTTLLLNCYARLKDVDQLERFIKSEGEGEFDVDTAIQVCRQGRYYEQAAYLAQKYGENDTYISILVENLKQYSKALNFIKTLPASEVGTNLHAYGKHFLSEWPEETTHLFITYYTGKYSPTKPPDLLKSVSPPPSISGALSNLREAADFSKYVSYLPFSDKPKSTTSPVASGSNIPHTATPRPRESTPVQRRDSPPSEMPTYQPPRPRAAFSIFVDFPDCFIRFLEAVMEDPGFPARDKKDVDDICTTLFEAYLRQARVNKEGSGLWEEKAKGLLTDRKLPVDTTLLLSHLASFREGTRIVRERASLQIDIFRSYTDKKGTRSAIEALHQYGPNEPDLYILALAYFCSDVKIMQEAGDELLAVLKKIEDDKLLTPLQIVKMLSGTGVAHLGVVKDFLAETIEKERRDIENNRKLIEDYRRETEKKAKEINDLKGSARVFQVTRCTACGMPLDLPTVHFMCKHSFHQRCLPDIDDPECPQCAKENATIRDLRHQQDEWAERQDLFRAHLRDSDDKFGVVANWFGKGVMNSVKLVDT